MTAAFIHAFAPFLVPLLLAFMVVFILAGRAGG
jgi:hypothetical protein